MFQSLIVVLLYITKSLAAGSQLRSRTDIDNIGITLDKNITTSSKSKLKAKNQGHGDIIRAIKLKAKEQDDVIRAPRLLKEIVLSKNKLIDTIVDYPEQFVLTFKLYPKNTVNDYNSIMRFTSTNNNCCNYGDRWIAMWFRPYSYRVLFRAGNKKDGNKGFDKDGVQGNKENEIKVEAIGENINFYINGVMKGTVPNTDRPSLSELKVYAGDKFYKTADATISDLTFAPVEKPDRACLPKINFELYVSGCSYYKLLSSIQQKLSNPDPLTHEITTCYHSAAKELEYHLPTNTTDNEAFIDDLCLQAHNDYFNSHSVPWSNVTQEGDKFDKEYYDGNGDWNEEHQSNYPHPPVIPGQASNVLNRDAERVDDLYETNLQRYPLQWPGDAPTSMTNFANCELQSAMCCWVSDRQANDNNGNCATPYDERCLDADPGDNTDLCAVDMSRSTKDSIHVDDGFAIFPEGKEGPVHCHGIAWGEDVMEADYRYRANNLFYVSMSDHLHDRGYVRSVQGAPMCGCVEHVRITYFNFDVPAFDLIILQ